MKLAAEPEPAPETEAPTESTEFTAPPGKAAAPVDSIHGAIGRLREVLKLPADRDYHAILLWAAQSHLVDFLDSVFYLGFTGPTGSGKGTAVEASIALTPKGVVVGSITEAALAAMLDEGMAVGMEEVDSILVGRGLLTALLRDGYTRRGKRALMVPDGDRGWKRAEVSLFGPKVFDFHAGLDHHLRNRTYVIEMSPDNSIQRALNAEHKAEILAPVRDWFARQVEAARASWTPEKVRVLWGSPTFRERVEALGTGTGREHVLGATMLLVCTLVGWDLDATVSKIMAARRPADEFSELTEAAEAILGLHKLMREIPTETVLAEINADRASLRLPPMTRQRLGGLLKDLGFSKEGRTYYKSGRGATRGKWVVTPAPLRKQLERVAGVERAEVEHGAEPEH